MIEVPWQWGRGTLSAEQDNRVKIPNGTAAVCGMMFSYGESQSLGKPGKAESIAGVPSAEKPRVRRPTEWISPFPRDYGKVRLSQKNGCGVKIDAAALLVF